LCVPLKFSIILFLKRTIGHLIARKEELRDFGLKTNYRIIKMKWKMKINFFRFFLKVDDCSNEAFIVDFIDEDTYRHFILDF